MLKFLKKLLIEKILKFNTNFLETCRFLSASYLKFFFWKNDDLFAYIDLLNTNLLMTPKALVVVDINIITTENFEIQYTLLINYL